MSDAEPVPYDVLKKGLRCPRCATPMTGHQTDDEGARPKADDYTICWYCEQLLRYRQTSFGWTLEAGEWPHGDAEMMLEISDLYGQLRALKGAGQGPMGYGQDVAERDGQR